MSNEHNWPERSLMYFCRAFDQLYRGQKYEDALPVYHIGFLDFTLFPEHLLILSIKQMQMKLSAGNVVRERMQNGMSGLWSVIISF